MTTNKTCQRRGLVLMALVLMALTVAPATANHAPLPAEPAPGNIATVAGNGIQAYGGDGGPATEAQLKYPGGVALGAPGDLYIADTLNHRVRRVEASTGIITTVAGTGERGYSGDGGSATSARMEAPADVIVDGAGVVYVSDSLNHRVRKIIPGTDGVVNGDSGEIITTVAGGGAPAVGIGDGGPATQAALAEPRGIASDRSGNLYIATIDRVRKVDLATGTISTVAGGGNEFDRGRPLRGVVPRRDGLPATQEWFYGMQDVAVDAGNNLFLTDYNLVRKVIPGADGELNGDVDEIITTAAGGGQPADGVGDDGPATEATLEYSSGLEFDDLGRLLISDSEPANRLRRVDGSGTITTIAGTGAAGYSGDGGPARQAQLNGPGRMAVHGDVVYVSDVNNDRIRVVKYKPLGVVLLDSPDPVGAGERLTYLARVESSVDMTGVTASVALPEGAQFESATSTQGACSPVATTVSCELGNLSAGGTAEVTVQVTAPTVGDTITATARVSSDQAASDNFEQTTSLTTLGCGKVIMVSTILTKDIGPCAGAGIVVGGDGVVLDLGGHRVFGFPGPGNGTQAGIEVLDRSGVTVKNGTVSDFDAGVFLRGGAGKHTVTGMTLRDNLGPDARESYLGDGIYVENSPAAHIVGNTIVNNGIFDGIGVYGVRSAEAIVEDNLVQDSRGPTFGSYGQGIIVNAFVDATDRGKTVPGMQILNNTVRGSDSAGISNFNSTDGNIVGNTVEGNGMKKSNGHGIGLQLGPGAAQGTRMLVQDNQVHGNGWSGIYAGKDATGNRILNNNATGNNVLNNGSFDLHDYEECLINVWYGNTWGSGGYEPACTSTGGTQAPITNRPVADFDGNGTSDFSVFRASTGGWFPQGGTDDYWGTEGDVAVPGDYDGVAGSEVAVFRPSTGTWFVKGGQTTAWGTADDLPVPGDYDGDKKADVAVFRPSTGAWYIRPSGGGAEQSVAWGTTGDIPVPGDYNGDGTTEIAVFRPSTGTWFVQGGATTNWGTAGDIPVPGDYDANKSTDMAVFRPSSGTWFVQGGATVAWGTQGDIPVPGDFDGNASADIAVFRPSSGTWFVNGGATTNWGTAGDQPLPLPPAIRQSLVT